jgi:F0F1-type ATP synthase membrane subunit b/b'
MSLLQALEIDITVLVQLGIAAVSFLILATAVFSSFQKAYLVRLKNTVGHRAHTEEVQQKILTVKQNYEERVRTLNSDIAKIFEKEREQVKLTQLSYQKSAQETIESLRVQNQVLLQEQEKSFQVQRQNLVQDLSGVVYSRLVPKARVS